MAAVLAEALAVPAHVVLALSQGQEQAHALLEVASLGQRLQLVSDLRAVHASCGDLAPLHALCAEPPAQPRDPALAPFVLLVAQSLAAFGRAEAALAAHQAEALAALAALGRQLARHAEGSSADARRLAQKPLSLELAVERQLLASIQAELAQRAQHIAASGGRPEGLPPFAAALEQLKGEAAAALHLLEERQQLGQQQQQQQIAAPTAAQAQAPADGAPAAARAGGEQPMPAAPPPRPAAAHPPQPEAQQAQAQAAGPLPVASDAQALASAMQGLTAQLHQFCALVASQQQQQLGIWAAQQPLLLALQQLLPPGMLQHAPAQQPPAALLQWQQQSPPPPQQQQQQQHQQQPGVLLRELTPTPMQPGAAQQRTPGGGAAAAAGAGADPLPTQPVVPEAIPLFTPLAEATAADGTAAQPASAPAGEGGVALHARLRGDAAPTSSGSECPEAAAAATAVAAAGLAQQPGEQQAPGGTAAPGPAFAFPQLDPPSQQAGTAAAGAAWPGQDGKENLTSSQSNSQEQVAPSSGTASGKQPGQPAPAGLGGPALMVPDSEDQTLPGTQPLGGGCEPQPGGAAAVPPAAQPAAQAAQQPEQQRPSQQQRDAAAAAAAAAAAGNSGAARTQGTPAPALAALLDSQRDSTSPKGAGRPLSASQAAAAAAAVGSSPQAAGPAAAAEPDSGGKTRGSSGSGSGVAAAGAPAPTAGPPAHEQLLPLVPPDRKRPASQDAEHWQQKRSRFGRESQEQQQQRSQEQAAQLQGSEAGDAAAGDGQQAGGAAAVQGAALQQQQQSSSGILCTQPPGSGDSPWLTQEHPAEAGAAAAAAPLAALKQLWQQQGVASPLLPLLATPGMPAASAQHGTLAPGSWQAPQVAGAAPGATPRFVVPTGGGGSLPAGAPVSGAAVGNQFLALLDLHGGVGGSGGAATPDALQAPGVAPVQHAQHHRLARSSSLPRLEQQQGCGGGAMGGGGDTGRPGAGGASQP